jgi:rare lipoprotein A
MPPDQPRRFRFSAVPLLFFPILLLWLLHGCGGGPERRPAPLPNYPLGYVERGTASWYGPGFHGHKTANGEDYDMHQLTAAHRTLPLGSVLLVRSLTSGRTVTVRVNDRGPFAKGRILDLSLAAAQTLAMTGAGTDRIELKVVDYKGRPGAMGYLRVQAASFADLANARSLMARLKGHYPDVRIMTVDLSGGRRYRVLVGQFTSEGQAEAVASRLARELEIEPLVLRDDT